MCNMKFFISVSSIDSNCLIITRNLIYVYANDLMYFVRMYNVNKKYIENHDVYIINVSKYNLQNYNICI